MIISLSEIEDKTVFKGEMDFTREEKESLKDVDISKPVIYEITVKREDEGFSIKGPVKFSLRFVCSRCLTEFESSFETYLDVRLIPPFEVEGEEVELKDEDLNVSFFTSDELDLSGFIWEEIMLNIPIKPLCDEKCKGICPVCGKNKNIEDCKCESKIDSPLAEKLKFFLKTKGV